MPYTSRNIGHKTGKGEYMEQEQGQPLQSPTEDFSMPGTNSIGQEQMDRARNVLATIAEVFGQHVVGQENLRRRYMITGGS